MHILRNLGMGCLSLVCLISMACGSAQPGGGSGGGDQGAVQIVVPIKVMGYDTAPTVYCWGNVLNFSAEVNQSGEVSLNVPNAPDIVQCNVEASGIWTVGPNGVCNEHQFFAGNVEITTWTGNNANPNYQFKVDASGAVTVFGQDIVFAECTDGQPPPLPCDSQEISFQFSGYETYFPEADLQMGIAGDGLGWTIVDLNTSSQTTTVSACADTFATSIEIGVGNYAPNSNGVCSSYVFKVNGTTITTGTPNGSGSYNYSFELMENGDVVGAGTTLPTYDCTETGGQDPGGDPQPDPTVSCDLEIVYLGTYTDPTLYIYGGGIEWGDTFSDWQEAVDGNGDPLTDINGDPIVDSDGNPGLVTGDTVYPDDFIANMAMIGGNQIWLVGTSILAGQSFYVNGVEITNVVSNGTPSGGNLALSINDTCQVVINGEIITGPSPGDTTGDTEDVDVVIPIP